MIKKVFHSILKGRDKLFSQIVCLYIYILYIRVIYLSCKDIFKRIDNDYYHFALNKKQWLLDNQEILSYTIITIFFFLIIISSLFLLYRKNRYFYAVLLFPVFFGLALMVVTPIFVMLKSH